MLANILNIIGIATFCYLLLSRKKKHDNERMAGGMTWDELAQCRNVPRDAVIKLRFMENEWGPIRFVCRCRDQTGVVLRVAAYAKSRTIPGFTKPGRVMIWKNPRFRSFADGSYGARIEEDLANITIIWKRRDILHCTTYRLCVKIYGILVRMRSAVCESRFTIQIVSLQFS